jgi:ZIP family zinc transporter
MAGIGFLLIMDHMDHHHDSAPSTGSWKLIVAIILHNIPEGMAIGVAFAAAMVGNVYVSVAAALAMSIGIAIHNIPTGAIVSLPLRSAGMTRNRSFMMGVATGVVQPLAALLTIWLASFIMPFMPYLLAFAAGAMIYVVVEELIPASSKGTHLKLGPIGFAIGFILMIILDATLHEA